MLVLYNICYIYIAGRNKYNWNAFNNVTKKMLVLYKICYIYIYCRTKQVQLECIQ